MASTPIDSSHLRSDREYRINSILDNEALLEALRKDNIHEVLSRVDGVTQHDIIQYLASQSKQFDNQILQSHNNNIAVAGSIRPSVKEVDFAHLQSDPATVMTEDEEKEVAEVMSRRFGITGKGTAPKASVGKAGTGETEKKPDDIFSIGDQVMQEWDALKPQLEDQIFKTQVLTQYQKNREELGRELRRILDGVKSGKYHISAFWLALTKASITERGTMIAMDGLDLTRRQQKIDQIADSLNSSRADPSSFEYMKESQFAQSKMRGETFALQDAMSRIQDNVNKISTAFNQGVEGIQIASKMEQAINSNLQRT